MKITKFNYKFESGTTIDVADVHAHNAMNCPDPSLGTTLKTCDRLTVWEARQLVLAELHEFIHATPWNESQVLEAIDVIGYFQYLGTDLFLKAVYLIVARDRTGAFAKALAEILKIVDSINIDRESLNCHATYENVFYCEISVEFKLTPIQMTNLIEFLCSDIIPEVHELAITFSLPLAKKDVRNGYPGLTPIQRALHSNKLKDVPSFHEDIF